MPALLTDDPLGQLSGIDTTSLTLSGGVLSLGGTKLFWDSVNARLGVGATPLAALHVESDNSSTSLRMKKTNAASNDLTFDFFSGPTQVAQLDVNCGSATGAMIFYTRQSSLLEALRLDTNQNVSIGSAAIATSATDGFLYITSCAGAPTGVPTAKTGRTPMVYDTTNNKFWIYNGAWKGVVLA